MYLMPTTRQDLLQFMPKKAVVAEIGVATGEFSKYILHHTDPRSLHLIDPWERQEAANYTDDPNNVAQEEADRRHAAVVSLFAVAIGRGALHVHRNYSVEASAQFPDGHFDWIFIDGNHTYEAVRDDLRAWAPKIKPDGIILGHDFANTDWTRSVHFGVVEAVQEFCRDTEWSMLALTAESFPTYMLAREPVQGAAAGALGSALRNTPTYIRIGNPEGVRFEQYNVRFSDGHQRTIMNFG